MVNIFKTTLKKDAIADIVSGKREVRFPITKFWATRLSDEYNLNKKTFVFKTFDSLEFSSPSNKDTESETYVFNFDKTFVDGNEFVIAFSDVCDKCEEPLECDNTEVKMTDDIVEENVVENNLENDELNPDSVEDGDNDEVENGDSDEVEVVDIDDVFEAVKQMFDEKNILETLYDSDDVIATNAKQVVVRPKGKILGSNKTLPLNNDTEIRVEFDKCEKVYFDATFDFDNFEDDINVVLSDIRKNNFVFIWKRFTGIFVDENGIYFGIKYSTRKSIGFNRKYNVQ
jgi:hypothetical protein